MSGDRQDLAWALEALGSQVRLDMLALIASAPEGMTAVQVARGLDRNQQNINAHFARLLVAGLVRRETAGRGNAKPFHLNPNRLHDVAAQLAAIAGGAL